MFPTRYFAVRMFPRRVFPRMAVATLPNGFQPWWASGSNRTVGFTVPE